MQNYCAANDKHNVNDDPHSKLILLSFKTEIYLMEFRLLTRNRLNGSKLDRSKYVRIGLAFTSYCYYTPVRSIDEIALRGLLCQQK